MSQHERGEAIARAMGWREPGWEVRLPKVRVDGPWTRAPSGVFQESADRHRVWQIAFDALNARRELYYRASEASLREVETSAWNLIRTALLAAGIEDLHIPQKLLVEGSKGVTLRPDGDGGWYVEVRP